MPKTGEGWRVPTAIISKYTGDMRFLVAGTPITSMPPAARPGTMLVISPDGQMHTLGLDRMQAALEQVRTHGDETVRLASDLQVDTMTGLYPKNSRWYYTDDMIEALEWAVMHLMVETAKD